MGGYNPGGAPRLLVNIFGAHLMVDWIIEVEPDLIKDGKLYFVAMKPPTEMAPHLFSATGLNGKSCWSQKPGIANRYRGCEKLRKEMRQKTDLIAVDVPANADSKWKARKEKR